MDAQAAATVAERRFDLMRRSDPDGWQWLVQFLQWLPEWVQPADAAGDLPGEFWRPADIPMLNRLNLPVSHGGLPLTGTAVNRATVFELIGRQCPALPLAFPGAGLSAPAVVALGSPQQQREYFARFVDRSAPVWGAFAITEPHCGSDATAMTMSAVPADGGYLLNGEKCFITNGSRAEAVVVFASLSPGRGPLGVRAFVVDRGTPGFAVDRCEDMMGMRASQLASLSFRDCWVPADRMLAPEGAVGTRASAFLGAQRAWDYMRPSLAALANGASAGALSWARCLLRDGAAGPRSRADALRHQVELFTARVEAAQQLALHAARLYDLDRLGSGHASMAKALAATTAIDLSRMLSRMLPLESQDYAGRVDKFGRDARAFDILEGTGDIQRLLVARSFNPVDHRPWRLGSGGRA